MEVPADTINKVCASSIRALEIADPMIRAGERRLVVTGGMESMSNAPYLLQKARFGYRLGDGELIDADDLRRATLDVRRAAHGRSRPSVVSRELGISREDAGRLGAPLARARGRRAQAEGRFADEIVPVGDVAADERCAADTTLEKLASLQPVFDPEGTTTAGNAPGVNDGASCVIVGVARSSRGSAGSRCSRRSSRRATSPTTSPISRGRPPTQARPGAREGGQDDRRRRAGRDQRGVRLGRLATRRSCSAPTRRS